MKLVAEPEVSPEERLEETEKEKSSATRDAHLGLSRSRRKIEMYRRRVFCWSGLVRRRLFRTWPPKTHENRRLSHCESL
jgi:hypothetical protein